MMTSHGAVTLCDSKRRGAPSAIGLPPGSPSGPAPWNQDPVEARATQPGPQPAPRDCATPRECPAGRLPRQCLVEQRPASSPRAALPQVRIREPDKPRLFQASECGRFVTQQQTEQSERWEQDGPGLAEVQAAPQLCPPPPGPASFPTAEGGPVLTQFQRGRSELPPPPPPSLPLSRLPRKARLSIRWLCSGVNVSQTRRALGQGLPVKFSWELIIWQLREGSACPGSTAPIQLPGGVATPLSPRQASPAGPPEDRGLVLGSAESHQHTAPLPASVPICTLTRGDGTVPCLPPASPSNSSRQQHEPSPQPRAALSSVGTEMLSHRRTDATVSRVSPSGQVYFSCLRNNQTAPSGCLAPAPRPGRGSLRPVSHSSLSRRCGRRSLWSSFAFSND